jgi:hypothetical protein
VKHRVVATAALTLAALTAYLLLRQMAAVAPDTAKPTVLPATAPTPSSAQTRAFGAPASAAATAAAAAAGSLVRRTAGPADPFDPTARWAQFTGSPGPGEVAYCGFGVAAKDSPTAKALARQAAAHTEAAADRLFASMRASPDPRARAAAQLALNDRDALADTARLTSDPTVYALALQACDRGATDARTANCSFLTAAQMARLDPHNVVPWLRVATEALSRGDLGGVAEATYRASLARESRLREYAFAELALTAIPPDWPPRDVMLASAKVLEIHASLALPSYLAVVRHCAKENMHDSNLQQTCSRLAQVLTTRGDSLVDYAIGRRLGERAGWPAQAVEAHHARLEAFMHTQTDGDTLASSMAQATDCKSLRRGVRLAFAHAHHGERAFAEAELARSGVGEAEILRRYRAAPAQAAASAAATR